MPDYATQLLDPPAGPAGPDGPDGVVPDTQSRDSAAVTADEIIAADLLVEEISIDGMCGVY